MNRYTSFYACTPRNVPKNLKENPIPAVLQAYRIKSCSSYKYDTAVHFSRGFQQRRVWPLLAAVLYMIIWNIVLLEIFTVFSLKSCCFNSY